MLQNEEISKVTPAWIVQVWASFSVAIATTAIGIVCLPIDAWQRGFLGMGLLFSVGSSLSLAKTLRDDHESKRLLNRLRDAKAEKIIREHEMSELGSRTAA